jgi:hypothetical protein
LPKTLKRVGVHSNLIIMFYSSKKKDEKKISLDDFKAGAKSVESAQILEMITGGIADDCHVESTPIGGGGGGGRNSGCY